MRKLQEMEGGLDQEGERLRYRGCLCVYALLRLIYVGELGGQNGK